MNEQLKEARTAEQAKADFSAWLDSERCNEVARAIAHKSLEIEDETV